MGTTAMGTSIGSTLPLITEIVHSAMEDTHAKGDCQMNAYSVVT
jgi:hypothetical protein